MVRDLLSFAVVAGLLTIVPGLDTALVLRAAVRRGRRCAFATALGVGSGTLVWGVAAAAGVSALVTASELGYTALRVAGAMYLVWLGISMIRDGFRHSAATPETAEDHSREGLFGAWARGLGTNLLNPKVGVFYVAVLPQFLPEGVSPLVMGCALALVHNVEGMLWFAAIICAASRAKAWLSRDVVRRAMDSLTGMVVVGFGFKLATSHR
ncbi:LysE family translocator [Nocardia alba]|uniref:Threonine/homoserine/homoserine lactone efflux protein n=1 Tax=Nocardia alba TaxID=225051 RepID=A0A4R1G615_9NOCA|nr:LysE family translocator [Nocardia alba]TCJ99151.1 threonine/homoserine/homoserine lactone efflux protein [Nocardia alba]